MSDYAVNQSREWNPRSIRRKVLVVNAALPVWAFPSVLAASVPMLTVLSPIQSDDLQHQKSPADPTVTLEVMAIDFDIGWQQEYVYLRVFSDGASECQLVKRKGFDKTDPTTLKRVLPTQDLDKLQTLLSQPELLQLEPMYKQRIADVLDAGTAWEIRIPRADQAKRIQVVAFTPDEAKARKRPYPSALVKLGCTIDALRAETTGEHVPVPKEMQENPRTTLNRINLACSLYGHDSLPSFVRSANRPCCA